MSESLAGWTHKMRQEAESAVLLTQTLPATITPPSLSSLRGKLKVAISGADPTGTVTIVGLDGSTAVTDTFTFAVARFYITDYFYTTISSIVATGITGTMVISLVDEANQDIMIETESALINCTFREVGQGSRLYEAFGVVDASLFYLRFPARIELTSTSKFRVNGFDGSFRVVRPIRKLFLPGTKICREKETYAVQC